MNELDGRIIGRVLSVDNFRIFIRLDEDISGAYKSGIKDIYEIARINSYLIIPVGSDRVVALINRVSMKEEFELDGNIQTITLPTSARYISATMLGTIEVKMGTEKFIQGVYNFPVLDNPVWYVTEKDLGYIFDDKNEGDEINYTEDYFLPIGTSPAFPNYRVKICPDKFFVKHAAILGNTGSGKSCTFTSIIRSLFEYNYLGKHLQSSHIIIFDTNGEYRDAFIPEKTDALDEKTKKSLQLINTYYIGGTGDVQVPYWFMNWDDFSGLLHPSENTQAPVLNRAIGLAKNEAISEVDEIYSRMIIQRLRDLYQHIFLSGSDYWKIANFGESINDIKTKGIILKDGTNVSQVLNSIYINGNRDYKIPSASELEPILEGLSHIINQMECENQFKQILGEHNIDMPTWFDYQELCTNYMDEALREEGQKNNRISEFISTLRLRMNSFLNDQRIAVPLMLKDKNRENREILPQFISFILGDFNHIYESDQTNSFVNQYNKKTDQDSRKGIANQITILDMSLLPYEVLDTIASILGRIIIQFVSFFLPNDRGEYPIVLVLEEAQNYIAEERDSIAKEVFERIAREGRKYGISLVVCSQRPSELSKTVLSQCNSFIVHRLQNPEDQKYVKGLVSSANADILDQLPIIPQQHAIITGDCVRTPIQVRINDVFPTPNSHDPKYIENWLKEKNIPYEETCGRWLGKKSNNEE